MQCTYSFPHSSWLNILSGCCTYSLFLPFSEIQLKTPNWLFGQRKHAETAPTTKVTALENVNEGNKDDANVSICGELNWLSSAADSCEEDNFRRW